ncbi:MAG: hypothetical protein C0187_06765 [Calditerrivibrio nitroreducens]|uniref:Histidine kinase domain-containing protein n=1 Tax=Calditerrivibrio nitroreducens TaxID=477976 RepID=A0A2J6WGU8_9BACT|nr:MAG: hypothetical protein C0187_06765 [Calditerrivibrio nitroreducens]
MDWYIEEEPKNFDTHFASPNRSTMPELISELEILSKSKIVDALMVTTGGLLAILNKNRQVLMINNNFLKMLGISNPVDAFGLRPGELVGCVHSKDMKAGCGTSEYCKTCGAVISIITALETNEPVEKKCIIDTDKNTLVLNVRTVPIVVDGLKVLLLFADDISEKEYCKAANVYMCNELKRNLESIISNVDFLRIHLPLGSFAIISNVEDLFSLAKKIYKDLDFYKTIVTENIYDIRPSVKKVNLSALLDDVRICFNKHYHESHKELKIDWNFKNIDLLTDELLFLKVISLLLENAVEHTDKIVKLWVDVNEKSVVCHIWNEKKIESDVAKRVFQKFFTTKSELGHGFGTFMAKFIAEKVLLGKLTFTTVDNGTTFSFEHPLR